MIQSTDPSFFDELKDWSERKLNLLKKYLEGATKILGSIDQVYYIDGFAGRGSYGKSDGVQIPGSPLRAAELAQQCKQNSRSYSLRCINVESDLDTFQQLQATTTSFGNLVINIHGSFVDSIDRILVEIGQKPVVCFLDPFGVDGMDWTAIQKLISRGGITDFWIRFDVNEVRRRDGYFDSLLPGGGKQFDILSRVYGIADKSKLHMQLAGTTSEDRKRNAVQLYLKRLCEQFKQTKGEGYAEAYRIGSLSEETKYFLVFATAGKKGFILASNIVYGVEEGYQREVERFKAKGQYSMFSFIDPTKEEIFQAKVSELKEVIWDRCKGQTLSRLDIHSKVLDKYFGIIKGPHVTSALESLENEGYILSRDGQRSNDRTQFKFHQPA